MAKREVHFIPASNTKTGWEMVDKIPYRGEILFETGGKRSYFKIGDGVLPYRDLPYANFYVELRDSEWVINGVETGLVAGISRDETEALLKAIEFEEQRQRDEKERQVQERNRIDEEKKRRTAFESWDKAMKGVIPKASETSDGIITSSDYVKLREFTGVSVISSEEIKEAFM